ncbi:hypothetical protein [Spiroplasma apis]|uniref:Uncharacterized protein n=1 Tax=Spiroplasma apis B31 TaxID=1276258 RepID=V5RKT4_SPIAP|nr:hypothetical protein [Spiroplasma apis]AHB36425.1 hypothetical protein SAPIS_v1c05800 [Spiroplasma apis B31]
MFFNVYLIKILTFGSILVLEILQAATTMMELPDYLIPLLLVIILFKNNKIRQFEIFNNIFEKWVISDFRSVLGLITKYHKY